jgi:hypothetical protein
MYRGGKVRSGELRVEERERDLTAKHVLSAKSKPKSEPQLTQPMAEKDSLEEIVLTRLVRFNASLQGIVTGLVAGLGVFIATNWLLIKSEEGEVVGPHLSLLSQFFIGYDVSFVGSVIGAVYGFIGGFVIGSSIAWMYNCLVDLRQSPRQ